MTEHAAIFWDLIRTPFQHVDLIWGIVPLYFGWLLNEMTSAKANFQTAIQTGFSFLWSGAHWTYQYVSVRPLGAPQFTLDALFAVNVMVTLVVLIVGAIALVSGIRHKYPRGMSFLGHSRFSNYFMITIFPIQSGYLDWSWQVVTVIVLFAIPIWLLMHLIFMPVRRK